jgi:quercetin dioxygenase-like cupin family protein
METAAIKAFASHAGAGKTLMHGVRLLASAAQTGGALELFEFDGAPSPPPHVHRGREEMFFVLDGVAEFTLGDDVIDAHAGSAIFIPRGVVQGFKAGPDARMLAFVTPAGLEGFFEMLGSALASGKTPKEVGEMSKGKYDITPVQSSTGGSH